MYEHVLQVIGACVPQQSRMRASLGAASLTLGCIGCSAVEQKALAVSVVLYELSPLVLPTSPPPIDITVGGGASRTFHCPPILLKPHCY